MLYFHSDFIILQSPDVMREETKRVIEESEKVHRKIVEMKKKGDILDREIASLDRQRHEASIPV